MTSKRRSVRTLVTKLLKPLRPVYDMWMTAIAGFSWVFVRVLSTVLFFTAFTIYGLSLRGLGKDPMKRRLDRDRETYWEAAGGANSDLSDFKRQY